jgi:hypothetical protein
VREGAGDRQRGRLGSERGRGKRHRQISLGRDGAQVVENFLTAMQRLGGPALGDPRKQTMFDGVPLGDPPSR